MYESQEISPHSGAELRSLSGDRRSESRVLSLDDEACVCCQIKATLLKLALSLTSEFMVQRLGTRPQSHRAAFLSHSLTFFTILNFVDLNSSDMIMFQLWLHGWDRMLHGAGDLWTDG